MSTWLSVSLLGLTALAQLWPLVSSQVIALRHPESNGQKRGETFARPQSFSGIRKQPRYSARPGNVIVHFDRNHEIQTLKYVLQDGRLATLYQRHPHQANGPTPIQVPVDVYRRDEQALGPSANQQAPNLVTQPPTGQSPEKSSQQLAPQQLAGPPALVHQPQGQQQPVIDHDETIEILDAKLQGISHLIGDHTTVDLNPEPLELGLKTSDTEHKPANASDDRLGILATIAEDAIVAGAHAGEAKLKKKAGIILDKLKAKVGAKLHELPGMIEQKLRAKSSIGELFLDGQGGRHKVIVEEDDNPGKAAVGDSTKTAVDERSNIGIMSQAQSPQIGYSVPLGQLPQSNQLSSQQLTQ